MSERYHRIKQLKWLSVSGLVALKFPDWRLRRIRIINVDFITITLQRMVLAHWRAFYEQNILTCLTKEEWLEKR